MECAGRALSFHSYQTYQEIMYQEFLSRSLTDKYSTLSTQMDQIIYDANSELTNLREKMKSMQIEQKSLEQKHDQLRETSRKKDQNMAALQHMYTSLKQEQFTGNIAEAADHDAENVLDAMQFGVSKQRTEPAKPSRAGSIGSSGSGARASHAVQGQRGLPGSRVGLTSARQGSVAATPGGQHRTRLNVPAHANAGSINHVSSMHQATPFRPPLSNLNPNAYGNPGNAAHNYHGTSMKVGGLSHGTIYRDGYSSGRYGNGVGNLNHR